MTGFLVYGLLGLGYATLAFGWTLTGYWPVSLALLALATISLYLVKRKFAPALDVSFALAVIAAALGISFEMPLPYALGGILFPLAAWDLGAFDRRLVFAAPSDDPDSIQRRHVLWLGLVLLCGLGLSLLALNLRLQFNFELAIGLVVLVFASLAALLGWLRRIER